MRLEFSGERVLAVVAHPDDADFLCAGTLARAKATGAAIGVLVLCQGDKGQPAPPIPNLGAVRREEMAAAAQMLEADLFHGEFLDGELVDGPEPRKTLIEVYRQFRPTLILAHSPQDYHADHRAASALAEAASWFAASLGHWSPSPAACNAAGAVVDGYHEHGRLPARMVRRRDGIRRPEAAHAEVPSKPVVTRREGGLFAPGRADAKAVRGARRPMRSRRCRGLSRSFGLETRSGLVTSCDFPDNTFVYSRKECP